MGKLELTKEQQDVVDARDCTLLVSAAAGSGKTRVLVERVIQKLLDKDAPQEIDRLLVVTFTNAAAAEMKERISARLLDVLGEEGHGGDAHLQKQVLLLRTAPIMTIHSFCLSLLREFFYELGLDPSFRIAEEAELVLLRADVMERLLEHHYEGVEGASDEETERRNLFLRLTECVGSGKNDDALVECIEKIYRFAQSYPFPEHWLSKEIEILKKQAETGVLSEDDPCIQMVMDTVRQTARDCQSLQKRAYAVCCQPDGPEVYQEAIEADGKFFEKLLKAEGYDEAAELLNEPFASLSRKKNTATEETKQQVKDIRAGYKKLTEQLKNDFFFADREQMGKDMAAMAPLIGLLLELCREFSEEFAKEKTERGILDFGDLEHYAVRLLIEKTEDGYAATETAKLLRGRFDEIMMDECQDSNLIQDLLLKSISKEEDGCPNRFMVGDVKQSIYKFRMAMPELFMGKYEEYDKYGSNGGAAVPGGRYEKIVLSGNFRSRLSVVDYVNGVFGSLMQKEFGGIEYDDDAKLYCRARYAPDTEDNKTELLITELEPPSKGKGEKGEANPEAAVAGKEGGEIKKAGETKAAGAWEDEQDKVKREAYSVAARIRRLIEDGFLVSDGEETDGEGNERPKFRPADYGDVTLLLRTMSGTAESYLEVFSELGVPAVAETQTGYFKAQEVAVALNALRMIDNPQQDIPLVSVLRSEMVGLSGEELARIRIKTKESSGKKKSFFEAVRQFAAAEWGGDEEAGALAKKLKHFLAMREGLCKLASCAGVAEVLRELYRVTRYLEFVRVKEGGERRCDNLAMLEEKAKSFEKTSYSGIFDFVRYIDRLIKYETDSGEAGIDAGAGAVRIMSIHKSKGLEAPIVVVAGLARQFNMMDVHAELVLHAELGIGMKYKDEVLRVEAPTLTKTLISRRLLKDLLTEELRVLYVAMTRAREKLILSAAVESEEKLLARVEQQACEGQKLSLSTLLSAKSHLDFLVPTVKYSMEQGWLVMADAKQLLQLTGEEIQKTQGAREQRAERYKLLVAKELGQSFQEELTEELERRKNFKYPYPRLTGKRKLSVSELKKAAYADEVQEELFPEQEPERHIPKFLQEKGEEKISGSERGTLYHKIMESMDFTKEYPDAEAVSEELSRLIACGRVRPEVRDVVSVKELVRFFASGLGRRMQAAAKNGVLLKEQPFVIGLPYSSVYKEEDNADGEFVMVQGVIDACFEEDGKLVLVDYKTDRVTENVKEELTKRYRAQMDYYEKALVQSSGKEVSERVLYAFTSGEEVLVERKQE